MSNPVQGLLMRCTTCDHAQQSDPTVLSGWYRVVGKEPPTWLCPRCIGDMHTPLCPDCDGFFAEDYAHCPWCHREEDSRQQSCDD